MYKKILLLLCLSYLFSVQTAMAGIVVKKDDDKPVNKLETPKLETPKLESLKLENAGTGIITNIDVDNFKIIIKHTGIKNPNISAATTIFWVMDNDILEKLKVGEKIEFTVSKVNTSFILKNISLDGKLLEPEPSKKQLFLH